MKKKVAIKYTFLSKQHFIWTRKMTNIVLWGCTIIQIKCTFFKQLD